MVQGPQMDGEQRGETSALPSHQVPFPTYHQYPKMVMEVWEEHGEGSFIRQELMLLTVI